MARDVRTYLYDIKERIQSLQSFVEKRDRQDLDTDPLLKSAIEREFITLGEALSQIYKVQPCLAQKIDDWRGIISFRNVLVHGYFAIDNDILWDTIQNDLPLLRSQVEQLFIDLDKK